MPKGGRSRHNSETGNQGSKPRESVAAEVANDDVDYNDVRDCLNGDLDAFTRLVRRHQSKIAAKMWRFSRDRDVCEELTQEAFVEAFYSLSSYRRKAPFINWLSKIATRVGYKYWRQQERRKERFHVPIEDWHKVSSDMGEDLDSSIAGKIIHSLLERLPAKDRLVLTLFYFEDCSMEEIASRMGWSRSVVKMRAYRARKKLRRIIEQEGIMEKLGWIL